MGHNIYKLEQLRNDAKTIDIQTINKRAKAKFSQDPLIDELQKLDSPLKEKYNDSHFCASVLHKKGNKLVSRYCKHRWCKICNRNRTGKLINAYSESINAIKDKQFVTLTIPNVIGDLLRKSIQGMIKTIQKIQDKRRKLKLPLFRAIRKLECTYNVECNNYHPHFHFIIDGEDNGNQLIQEWLKYYPDSNIKGQDIRQAKEPLELFKYFTKLTSNTGKKYINGSKLIDEWAFPEALDVIFQSIQKIRIIQPMGGIKYVSDEIEELQAEEMDETLIDKGDSNDYFFIWSGENWFNPYTGELFSSYKPTINQERFRKKIRYLEKNYAV